MPIYIQRNGQEHGPYNEPDARMYLQAGQLLANDLARTDNERGWRPLAEVLAGNAVVTPVSASPAVQVYGSTTGNVAMGAMPQTVTVVDVKMPFGSMVVFMIKWAIASIPALIILWLLLAVIGLIITVIFSAVGVGFGSLLK